MSARHTGSMDRPTMDYQSKRARKRCSSVADGSVHSYFMCKRTALIPRQPPEQMMSHTHRFCFTSKCSLSFFSLSLICLPTRSPVWKLPCCQAHREVFLLGKPRQTGAAFLSLFPSCFRAGTWRPGAETRRLRGKGGYSLP